MSSRIVMPMSLAEVKQKYPICTDQVSVGTITSVSSWPNVSIFFPFCFLYLQYEVAQMYMVLKMQQENTTTTEGVDVLENRPFEDSVYGQGNYTSKLYSFQRRKPGMHIPNANQCPSFAKLHLTIDTIHVADNGKSENVHGLNKDQLALRQVEVIDIASSIRDYWSYIVGSCNVDLSKFRSARTKRGPLMEGWRDRCNPVMTAYKLITVDAPYWGFGKRLEQVLLAVSRINRC
ncbi:Phosphatidylinositol transfer protein 1 [Bienertia sinuspersici]